MLMRHLKPALTVWLLATLVCGLLYPLATTGLAQLLWPAQANGSQLRDGSGQLRGSALLAQPAAADLFQPRSSATAYANGGASNLAVSNPARRQAAEARAAVATTIQPTPLSAVMLSASASGLDPHLPLADALAQVPRVAAARGLDAAGLELQVRENASSGLLGPRVVNVMLLNWQLTNRE